MDAKGHVVGHARPLRRAVLLGVLVISLVASACGSRLSHQRLLADAQRATPTPGSSQSGVGEPVTGVQSSSSGVASSPVSGTPAGTGISGASSGTGPVGVSSSGAATQGGAVAGSKPASCSGTKAPVIIGTVGEQSGPIGSAVVNGVKAVQAWVAATNAKGGVNCHPIRYIVEDDGGDPSRQQALVQQVVEQDHVIGFVYMDAVITGQSTVNYLTQKGIPVIGDESGSPWFYQSPMYFPQIPSADVMLEGGFAGLADQTRGQGKTKLAVVTCVEVPSCADLYNLGPAWASKFGMNVVYRAQVSVAQPDYTSTCQSAQAAGAQLALVTLDLNSMERWVRSCNSVNYHPQYSTESNDAYPALASVPGYEGMVVGLPAIPWVVTSNPGVAEFQATIRQYAPGLQPDHAGLIGWISAQLFAVAAANLSDPPTSQSILSGLWSIKNNDLGGLTVPWTFTQGQNAPRTLCYWLAQVKNGQWISPNNGQRACTSP